MLVSWTTFNKKVSFKLLTQRAKLTVCARSDDKHRL